MKGITVLFEDDNLLVLNKPAGLPVQGGRGIGTSLDSLLAQSYEQRPLLVHRLDKDTSGIIVTAKTRECAALCSQLFSDHALGLKKTYLALCAGILDGKGAINETLIIKGRELEAKTSYYRRGKATLRDFGEPDDSLNISLGELLPSTGRMHQIRRHLAKHGHPILGDDKYGDFALNKKLKKTLNLRRLLLHAHSLYLPPSLVRGGLEISAPLPEYFREILARTGITPNGCF